MDATLLRIIVVIFLLSCKSFIFGLSRHRNDIYQNFENEFAKSNQFSVIYYFQCNPEFQDQLSKILDTIGNFGSVIQNHYLNASSTDLSHLGSTYFKPNQWNHIIVLGSKIDIDISFRKSLIIATEKISSNICKDIVFVLSLSSTQPKQFVEAMTTKSLKTIYIDSLETQTYHFNNNRRLTAVCYDIFTISPLIDKNFLQSYVKKPTNSWVITRFGTQTTINAHLYVIKYIVEHLNVSFYAFSPEVDYKKKYPNPDIYIPTNERDVPSVNVFVPFYSGRQSQVKYLYILRNSLRPWYSLIAPVGFPILWITLGGIVIAPILLHYITKIEIFSMFLLIFNPIIGQNTKFRSNSTVFRFLFSTFLIYCIITTETYKGNYVKYLTRNYGYPHIGSIEDLVNGNYSIFSYKNPNSFIYSGFQNCSSKVISFLDFDMSSLYYKNLRELRTRICQNGTTETRLDGIADHLIQKVGHVLVAENQLISTIEVAIRQLVGQRAVKVSDSLVTGNSVWLLRRLTPRSEKLYQMLRRLKDGGVIEKLLDYEKLATRYASSHTAYLTSKYGNHSLNGFTIYNGEPEVLATLHVYPMFIMLVGGLVMAMITFIYEVCVF